MRGGGRARGRGWALLLAASLASLHAGAARAADPPAPPSEARLGEAKALFQEGNNLRRQGDLRGALEFYLRSRAIVPSMPNTFNAAFCLHQLGRIDEALELYEEVLIKFRHEVSEREQQQLSDSMATLRRKLGAFDISGDVGALLLIDGKVRGTLPVVAPIHVLPGAHTLRVLKESYEPFERRASVEAGTTVSIDVRLRALAAAGRLRVDSDNLAGAELVLDGAPLGVLPWEGTLAPGPHLISAHRERTGSPPQLAQVVQGQTVTVSVHGVPVSPEVRVAVDPSTADMWIDGVPIGKGQWRGRLPLGSHELEAREMGYVAAREQREIGPEARGDVLLALRVDPSHPRWASARHPGGVVRVELFGGAALGASIGSDASGSCGGGACSQETIVTGGAGGIRGAYVLPSGIFAEWETGYLRVSQGVRRTINEPFSEGGTSVAASAALHDELRLGGPFFGAGVGYAARLGAHLDLRGALDVGALVVTARDYVSGTATGGGRSLDLSIGASGSPVHEVAPFVLPEVRLGATFGAFEAGLGVGVAIFPFRGPSYPTGELRVYGASCGQHPGAVDCAPGTTLGSDRAYGPFGLLLPTLFVGEKF